MAIRMATPRYVSFCSRCHDDPFDLHCDACRPLGPQRGHFYPTWILDRWTNLVYVNLTFDGWGEVEKGTVVGKWDGQKVRYEPCSDR